MVAERRNKERGEKADREEGGRKEGQETKAKMENELWRIRAVEDAPSASTSRRIFLFRLTAGTC